MEWKPLLRKMEKALIMIGRKTIIEIKGQPVEVTIVDKVLGHEQMMEEELRPSGMSHKITYFLKGNPKPVPEEELIEVPLTKTEKSTK